ncbi:MAG: hypothetical protein Q4D34_01685 [Eggerthellaceae bacterium]|nr:hypothetical protein [Eggerthellaceae bacterium]
MIAVIAFSVIAFFFVLAIVMMHHAFVKNANGEEAIITRAALGTCLAVCLGVIAIVPML